MKNKIQLFLLFLTHFISVTNSTAQINIPPSQIVCASCGAKVQTGEAHKPNCPYYKKPTTTKVPTSNSNNLQQQIVMGLFSAMFNNMMNNSNTQNQTEADKIRKQRDEWERQMRLARQRKYNDSVADVKHKKMMSEYKTLDAGTKDLQYKGLMDNNSNWDASVVVLNEQNLLDKNTQTWVDYQKEQFKIRMEQPNYWCEKYNDNLIKQDSALKTDVNKLKNYLPPKRLSEVETGDIIIVGNGNPLQTSLDNKINDTQENVAHTLTCVKVVNGKKFYLDNQLGEGPRIITEEQMVSRYGNRDLTVAELRGKGEEWKIAQPLNKEEGDKLWNKALELHNKNRDKIELGYETKDKSDPNVTVGNIVYSNYGLYKSDNMVCSEASWMLINSTGRYQIPEYKSEMLSISGIKFSPTNFYNTQQYFIITPLAIDKK